MKYTFLYINTSLYKKYNIGIYRYGYIYDYIYTSNNISKDILNKINNILKKNNLEIKDFNTIICIVGPGSFISTRIGICISQGLSFGSNIPILYFSIPEILFLHIKKKSNIFYDKIIFIMKSYSNEFIYWSINDYNKKNNDYNNIYLSKINDFFTYIKNNIDKDKKYFILNYNNKFIYNKILNKINIVKNIYMLNINLNIIDIFNLTIDKFKKNNTKNYLNNIKLKKYKFLDNFNIL
ncbi:glycoprotease [endosymbiont of Sipalinus gigas]|uniref:hypothetical protein n=1 Tax=endosymbiont of Sipalinus gigas TaxID=1972134 RepID=UPI000DC6DDDD|nr:hypothetical protein [endosymbiont of Sipalinus gigas]BBA85301.1 glycoprotease [endosymbiont of Sipalinus gigas]